jgi:hypothetical protein
MFLDRHVLRGRWWRYVVCRSYQASQCDGRVLSGFEAVSVIVELLHGRNESQVRVLYADLTNSFNISRVSNDEVQRWFSRELRDGVHGVTGLVLVEVPMFGRLGHSGEPASVRGGSASEAERLVRAMDAARGRSDLEHEGNYFRLAVVARAAQMPGRDSYEALGAPEAQRLLLAMAENVRRPDSVCELLKKAAVLVAPGQSGQSKEQLVLLRRYRSTGLAAERAEPPMTPPQYAKALKPRSYIIVEVYTSAGTPKSGVKLELTAPSGAVSSASTDENGEAGLHDIAPGSYRIALPGIDMSAWKASGGASTLLREEPGRTHVVRQGEGLLRIAHAHGQPDWQRIWNASQNAALKAKRKSPNILLPGDRVVLPDVRVGQIERATDATHRIVIDGDDTLVTVQLRLQARFKKALEGLAYTVAFVHRGELVTRPGAGPSNGVGLIKEQVPVDVESILIAFERPKISFTLRTNVLDPMQDAAGGEVIASGVSARLRALGYAPAGSSNAVEAVARFQQAELSHTDPTGELDTETLNKLEELYGA